jgi:lysine-N-methylase
MKLYAPKYYTDFICIADKCTHSCCVGWEIDIDPHTLSTYQGLTGGYGEVIKNSVDPSGDSPHFSLCHGDRCPHLDERGLCRIITNLGEDYLCDICREHPRFYNQTSAGLEVGLGMACEEAARIILSSDGYASLTEIGEAEGQAELFDFDPLPYRARLFDILQASAMTYPQKEAELHRVFGVSLSHRSDGEWRELLNRLEYLDEGHKALFTEAYASDCPVSPAVDQVLTRALAYFVYRHATAACDAEDFCAAVGFGLFCTRLMASVWAARGGAFPEAYAEIGQIVSEELEYSEENTEVIKAAF